MKQNRIAILIQARSNSTRFPGKIYEGLPTAQGPAILKHIYRRLSSISKDFLTMVLAPEDDTRLLRWCSNNDIAVFAGSHKDVRERYREAVQYFQIETVVRATGDNPCVDPKIVQESIEGFLDTKPALFSFGNLALGLGVEVISAEALLQDVLREQAQYREHVSAHIKQNPQIFTSCHPNHNIMEILPSGQAPPRITVDFPEDLEVVRNVFACLGEDFDASAVLQLYKLYPDFFESNQTIEQISLPAALAS